MVAQRNPIYSAFALIVTLCSLSGIYGLLGSPFIAALQIIVYAGAIMVLFLFVLMLLNVQARAATRGGARGCRAWPSALARCWWPQAGVVLLARREPGPARRQLRGLHAPRSRELLFSPRFLYAFEATSVLILAALVGRGRARQEGACWTRRPLRRCRSTRCC